MSPPQPRTLLNVKQFCERHPGFTQAGIRNLIHCSNERVRSKGLLPGNGLKEAGAFLKCGRRIVIDEGRFFAWLDRRNGVATGEARP